MDNSADAHFEGKDSQVKATYQRLISALQEFGSINVTPKQTSIRLEKNRCFSGVPPCKSYFNLEFRTDYKIDDPRITRLHQLSARRFEHTVKLQNESEIDDQRVK